LRRVWVVFAFAVFAALAMGERVADAQRVSATTAPKYVYPQALRRRDAEFKKWLPRGEDLFEPWRRHLAATGPLGWDEMFKMPSRQTFFLYGDAGPPRVGLVYDPVHRVALYYQGCCAWQETVLASVATRPPGEVISADLGTRRTPRGIALGVAPSAVRRAYGPAAMHRSTMKPALRVLSYWRDQHVQGSACAWFDNFVFRDGRLIEIQTGHGC
jgi:hypothetical protein